MNFSEWIKLDTGWTRRTIAKHLRVTPTMVSCWLTGRKEVAASRCQSIVALTGGAVTLQELRPHDWQNYWPELEPLAPQVPETPFEVKKEATQNIAYSTQPELALEIPETSNTNAGTAQVAIKIIVQEAVCPLQ